MTDDVGQVAARNIIFTSRDVCCFFPRNSQISRRKSSCKSCSSLMDQQVLAFFLSSQLFLASDIPKYECTLCRHNLILVVTGSIIRRQTGVTPKAYFFYKDVDSLSFFFLSCPTPTPTPCAHALMLAVIDIRDLCVEKKKAVNSLDWRCDWSPPPPPPPPPPISILHMHIIPH